MSKNKKIIIGIVIAVLTLAVALIIWQGYRKPIITIEPPEGVSPSEWTPFREEWQPMVEKIAFWQDGSEWIINPESSEYVELGRILLPTLHKLNLQARCVFSEEKIQEIKRKDKVVELVFKQAEDFPISQWVQEEERYHIPVDEKGYRILESLKTAIFVLEDNLDEGMEGHILVGSERKERDEKCSWKVTKEDLGKLGPCERVVGYAWSEQYGCKAISGCDFDPEIVPFKTKDECEMACGRMWSCWAIRQKGSKELDKTWINTIETVLLKLAKETEIENSARGTVERFMMARIYQRNQPFAESFLTENAKKEYSQLGMTLIGTSNPHFVKYEILKTQKLANGNFKFKVRIYEEYTGEGAAGYFEEDLILKKFGNKYLIDEVKRGEYQAIEKPIEDNNFKKYSNPLLGIEFNYPKNFIPYLRDHEYLAGQPSRFTSGKDSYAPLNGNSYFVIDLGSSGSIDQYAKGETYHKLRPFGENPLIKKLEIEGQEARVVIPSDSSNNETELIVKLKTPVLVSDNYWPFLVISVSRDLNREVIKVISESLHFIK